MKKILFLFLLSLGLLNAEIVTKTTTKQAQGEGYGANYEEALSKALADAVGRMNGVKLSSDTFFITNSVQNGKDRNLQKVFNDKILKTTNGKFDSYDVLQNMKTSSGHKVKVLIKKSKTTKSYKTPGFDPNSRRRIAVIPSYASHLMYDVLGQKYSRRHIGNILTSEVVNAITQTRKFTVLDREAKQAYDSEKALIQLDGNKEEFVKIGKVLGTDYLYVLSLDNFSIEKLVNKNDLTGKVTENVNVEATIDYRIIVMATRQVKYSNSKIFSFAAEGKNDEQYFRNSLKTIAKALTDDIINNIYPVKIIALSNGEAVISQKLKQGERYEVFSLGERMYDSYTKEQLGRLETKVGVIEISRVTPKMSYGRIIEGNVDKGNICRLIDNQDGYNQSNVEYDGGGVDLPFDN